MDGNSRTGAGSNDPPPFVIRIPSYDEVADSSHPKPNPIPNPTPPSFSQSFNFLKNTEFYSPPAPPPPPPPSTPSSSNRNAILVSHRQKGNPVLKHIRNVRWVFADVTPDYVLGQSSCALYLSIRYHLLHPDYLYFRIRELQKAFKLRIVLCHVDLEDVLKPLLEVTKTALLHDCTLLCAWSLEECGRYLETVKVYENKPPDLIQGQMDMDYSSRLNHALTAVRHVNKTDVVTLGSTFGSLASVMDASMEDLSRCPGIGERKVRRLYDTFHEPFKRVVAKVVVENGGDEGVGSVSGSGRIEEGNESRDVREEREKEAEISVRSALEAAFAKYSGRKRSKEGLDKGKEKVDDDGKRGKRSEG